MLKSNYKELRKRDIIKPFFIKTEETLKQVYSEIGSLELLDNLLNKYKEISIESTMKLLIRCKMVLHARGLLCKILRYIVDYE